MQWTALLLKQFWFIHLRLFLQKSIQINSDHWYRLDQLGSTQKRNETREKIIVRLEVKIYPKVTWNKPNQVNYDLLLLSVKLPSALGILFFPEFCWKECTCFDRWSSLWSQYNAAVLLPSYWLNRISQQYLSTEEWNRRKGEAMSWCPSCLFKLMDTLS